MPSTKATPAASTLYEGGGTGGFRCTLQKRVSWQVRNLERSTACVVARSSASHVCAIFVVTRGGGVCYRDLFRVAAVMRRVGRRVCTRRRSSGATTTGAREEVYAAQQTRRRSAEADSRGCPRRDTLGTRLHIKRISGALGPGPEPSFANSIAPRRLSIIFATRLVCVELGPSLPVCREGSHANECLG